MNMQLNHLIANERTAEFSRAAERARLAEEHRAANATSSSSGRTPPALVRLPLWLTGRRADAAVEG
jgi:hypothetical protein